ncbi:MAG: hypothetical protein J4F41_09475, partial [Alphaproteobacteria bacterium]|nr:hypothetical protein [Alphaproteobacteria bacterium]
REEMRPEDRTPEDRTPEDRAPEDRTDEIILLQHRLTEQTVLVPLSSYLSGARGKFRNFRLRGSGKFIAPSDLGAEPELRIRLDTPSLPPLQQNSMVQS